MVEIDNRGSYDLSRRAGKTEFRQTKQRTKFWLIGLSVRKEKAEARNTVINFDREILESLG